MIQNRPHREGAAVRNGGGEGRLSARPGIALITTSYPYGNGGSEAAGSFVKDLAEILAEHANVLVIAPGRMQGVDKRREGLTIQRFAVPRLPLSLLSPFNPAHWFWITWTVMAGRRAAMRLAAESEIDHILALWALPSGYWARSIWKRYGIPYSTWALGSDIWSLRKVPLVRRVLRQVLMDSHTCFADGCLLKQDVELISGRSCEFLASVRNLPVPGGKRLSNAPPYRLAFLGRWHPNKGVDLLIESLKMLGDEDWDKINEVRICGGGPLENKVRLGCDDLRKDGRPVAVGGYLCKEEAAELLTWADYLLLPSRIESIPVIFSDAMQAGCPVVATPVGDLPRLMGDNEVGILADDVTVEAFAGAMRSAVAVPPERFSPGLKEACKMFDVHRTASRLLDMIR